MTAPNPLFDDRLVDLLLESVADLPSLASWPAFADQSYDSYRLVLDAARRLARGPLFEAYRPMDQEPPRYEGGRVHAHPAMRRLYPLLVETGLLAAARPPEVGGLGLPLTLTSVASAYLMAGNLGAYGYLGLTAGAAHLLEAFGGDELRARLMAPLYEGRWTGTMALTEPQAGSSLADVATRARRGGPGGSYLIEGSKVFISGGDHDLAENIVHMVLARVEGAPPGVKGVSLFAVPRLRPEGGGLAPNDVQCTGLFHKMGWRGIASVALSFGEGGDCRGYLVGEENRGVAYMFQMMNEARLMVGFNGVATASVAYHEALAYARSRPQGRPPGARDPRSPQVPIVEHADVRRMLLRQKAIVEGGLGLLVAAARFADASAHAPDAAERERAALLLDLLTPVAKSFPAEYGFEANALAVQVHGGYGYTSEYLPEAWLRDQKLNSIHEGTTGIQGLDLLGRKVMAGGGAAFRALEAEVSGGLARARRAGVESAWCDEVARALGVAAALTAELGGRGLAGDVDGMLRHSADYLALLSVLLVAWQLVAQAGAALERGDALPPAFVEGKLRAARYWLSTELPRVELWAALCRGDDSYALMPADAF
ncbi:MAG TPA: acyl-CoA dehydrogenase [Polyangiaceae bacterium]|nr:acyl-CoA dehydrogenase [Polyangiaceae bacterium]